MPAPQRRRVPACTPTAWSAARVAVLACVAWRGSLAADPPRSWSAFANSKGGLPKTVELSASGSHPSKDRAGKASMLLCTQVRNQSLNYIVEWIEFHKLQGFGHVRIYNQCNSEAHLRKAAQETWVGDVLEPVYGGDLAKHNISVAEARSQDDAFGKCSAWAEERGGFDWVAIHDVDEFVFSPQFHSVQRYATRMLHHRPDVTSVYVQHFRYGRRGRVDQVAWPELLIEDQPMRGPSRRLNEPDAQQSVVEGTLKAACALALTNGAASNSEPACMQQGRDRGHKSLFRTGRGCKGWVHHPKSCTEGTEVYAAHTQLRGNHYFLRSQHDAEEKTRLWRKQGPVQLLKAKADRFYDTVFDGSALPYSMLVRARMRHLHWGPGGEGPDTPS